ncbi:MAG: DUF4388 domain-containing protein [Actinomycetota bacterium]
MNLSGTLTDWTVADLLNVMKVTGKTASLHVKGNRSGVIHFSDGRVVGAVLDDDSAPTGSLESRATASETLFVLSALNDGRFEVGPFQGPEGEGWDVDTLLADMNQLDQLESDLNEAGMRSTLLMLKDEIAEPITIQPDDWWALASLVSVLSFDQLEDVFGRGRAIRLLHALWRLDLIETVQEEKEETAEPAVPSPETTVPVLADEEPTSVDLSQLADPEPTTEEREQEAPASEEESFSVVEPSTERDDESWLDEIAAAADAEAAPEGDLSIAPRNVQGVSAPASTVLTGAVLDEMRRLRVRPTGD